jgi:hypothetical protein
VKSDIEVSTGSSNRVIARAISTVAFIENRSLRLPVLTFL